MSKVKIELNSSGIDKLLHSAELERLLGNLARQHAGGWETDTKQMQGGRRSRVIASIYTEDPAKVEAELNEHRIVGGLG